MKTMWTEGSKISPSSVAIARMHDRLHYQYLPCPVISVFDTLGIRLENFHCTW